MSIFKEPFKPNIKKQLEKRQQAMLARTPQDIVYINGRNSWIRMSSSVNVLKDNIVPAGKDGTYTIKQLKEEGNYDNSLAKKYILQGGCLNENGTLKSGVGMDFTNAYSRQSADGKTDYRLGIRPMPGITGMEVKSRGAYGSIRTVTVNFQCWDIHQLEDLELLYMRPGYTVLVEWGWAPYFDENNNLKSTVDFYNILTPKKKEEIWRDLDIKMAQNGNYEAMFGYVKNYSWNARPDGGYDCTTEIISLGEVIESMKINYTPNSIIDKIKKTGLITPNLEKISSKDWDSKVSDAAPTVLGVVGVAAAAAIGIIGSPVILGAALVAAVGAAVYAVYDLFQTTDEEKVQKAYTQNIVAGLFGELYLAAAKADSGTEDEGQAIYFQDKKYPLNSNKKSTYTLFHKTININKDEKDSDKIVGEDDEQYYISLGSVVSILNNYVLLSDGTNQTTIAPLSVQDMQYTGNINEKTGEGMLLALTHPLQISIDPRVCLIPNRLWTEGIKVNLTEGGDSTKPGFTAGQGKPVIQFNHTLGSSNEVRNAVSAYIHIAAASSKINNKQALADSIKDWLQGPSGSRHSAAQVEQNVKEASAMYKVLANEAEKGKFKILKPNSNDIIKFGLEIDNNMIGKDAKNFLSYHETFYQLMEDDQAMKLDDDLAKYAITPEGEDSDKFKKAADVDPVQEEQEKLEKQQKELNKLAESGKKGIQFLNNLPLQYFTNNGDPQSGLGIIGNIFVNLRLLYELALDDNLAAQDKKEKKEIAVYDYVKSLMSKIQEAIGNVNNFDIHVDPVRNVAQIIDINYCNPEDPETVYKNAFELQMHNLKSTVRSYKLESKIFQEQANIVAIGAQVGGGALGTDTTSLVAFNRSIWDRIIPVKSAPIDDLVSSEATAKVNAILSNLEVIYKFFGRLKAGWFDDSDYDADKASEYTNALRDLINDLKALIASKSNNKAILPTVLSIEMDGIGGLIIGTIFKVPLDILPKGYKGKGNGGIGSNLGYLITGLGHNVGNGDWVTKIDAQTIILDNPPSEIANFDYSNITISINPSTEKEAVQQTPAKVNSDKPKLQGGKGDADIIKKYGQIGDTSQLTTMTFPYPMYYDGSLVKTAKCHKLVKDDLEAIFKEILSTFGLARIKQLGLDQYSGLYNVRNKREGSTPSIHSWGIAIDLYAAKNSLKMKTGTALFSKPEYKTFIDIWYKHNFKSFGRELGYDWMHFQVKDAHF
jgi:hypothetical protein